MARHGILHVSVGDEDPTAEARGSCTDEDLRDTFDTLLRTRRLASIRHFRTPTRAMLALARAAFVLREVGDWAVRELDLVCSPAAYQLLSPERRRQRIRQCLKFQLPIMQPQAWAELDRGLAALDLGETEKLLQPTKTRRRRASPARIVEAERGILLWIEWQHGLGRKKKNVEAEVASAIGCSAALFAKWKVDLVRIYGHEAFYNALFEAQRLGRSEAYPDLSKANEATAEGVIRRFTAITLERDLAVLVARFRAGSQKRRMPKPDNGKPSGQRHGRKPPH